MPHTNPVTNESRAAETDVNQVGLVTENKNGELNNNNFASVNQT